MNSFFPQYRQPASAAAASRPSQTHMGVGFSNLGNTCFMNATLQAMCHLRSVFAWLQQHASLCNRTVGQYCVNCELHNLFAQSLSRAASSVRPDCMVKGFPLLGGGPGGASAFRLGRQEDAQEYLVQLLDLMERHAEVGPVSLTDLNKLTAGQLRPAALLPQPGAPRPLPPRLPPCTLFRGRLCSRVVCLTCSGTSDKRDPFETLSLEIAGCDSVESCLAAFTRPEELRGANLYRCESPACRNTLQPGRRSLAVEVAPKVLVIHLKRFAWRGSGSGSGGHQAVGAYTHTPYGHNFYSSHGFGFSGHYGGSYALMGGGSSKDVRFVRYGMQMDFAPALRLAPAQFDAAVERGAKPACAVWSGSQYVVTPKQPLRASDALASLGRDVCLRVGLRYALSGTVRHEGGSPQSGHYFAHINTGGGAWMEFNDSARSSVADPVSKVTDGRAYLLFYQALPETEAIIDAIEQAAPAVAKDAQPTRNGPTSASSSSSASATASVASSASAASATAMNGHATSNGVHKPVAAPVYGPAPPPPGFARVASSASSASSSAVAAAAPPLHNTASVTVPPRQETPDQARQRAARALAAERRNSISTAAAASVSASKPPYSGAAGAYAEEEEEEAGGWQAERELQVRTPEPDVPSKPLPALKPLSEVSQEYEAEKKLTGPHAAKPVQIKNKHPIAGVGYLMSTLHNKPSAGSISSLTQRTNGPLLPKSSTPLKPAPVAAAAPAAIAASVKPSPPQFQPPHQAAAPTVPVPPPAEHVSNGHAIMNGSSTSASVMVSASSKRAQEMAQAARGASVSASPPATPSQTQVPIHSPAPTPAPAPSATPAPRATEQATLFHLGFTTSKAAQSPGSAPAPPTAVEANKPVTGRPVAGTEASVGAPVTAAEPKSPENQQPALPTTTAHLVEPVVTSASAGEVAGATHAGTKRPRSSEAGTSAVSGGQESADRIADHVAELAAELPDPTPVKKSAHVGLGIGDLASVLLVHPAVKSMKEARAASFGPPSQPKGPPQLHCASTQIVVANGSSGSKRGLLFDYSDSDDDDLQHSK